MPDFDDRPLERAPLGEDAPPQPKRASLTPVAIVAIGGLALGGAAAWWWTSGNRTETPAPIETPATTAEIPPVKEAPPALPPVGEMDTFLRAMLATLSAHPDLARWLATDDLIRQMARGIDRVSRGQTPAPNLAVLRPSEEFKVSGPRNRVTIDPASYRRYERFATLMESLDPQRVAEVYRTIHPRLDEAYRSLGRSDASVDQAVRVALQQLIDTPVPEGEARLVPGRGATFAYADTKLEQLSPIQKQLLRMGPDNARRIQARLREIQTALAARASG